MTPIQQANRILELEALLVQARLSAGVRDTNVRVERDRYREALLAAAVALTDAFILYGRHARRAVEPGSWGPVVDRNYTQNRTTLLRAQAAAYAALEGQQT